MESKIIIPSKEDIVEYYINQNHSVIECVEFYNVSKSTFGRWCKKYNIKKDPQLMIQLLQRTLQEKYGVSNISKCEYINSKKNHSKRKTCFDKEELYNYYIIQNHSIEQCAVYFQVSVQTINNRLKEYNIHKSKHFPNKEEVIEYYVNQNLSVTQCAEHFQIAQASFKKLLIQYNIDVRGHSQKRVVQPSVEELTQLYLTENLSQEQIAIKYNACSRTVSQWLSDYGLVKSKEQKLECFKKTCQEKYHADNPSKNIKVINKIKEKTTLPVPVSYEDLYQYYITENHNRYECGDKFGVPKHAIDSWLKKYHICKDTDLVILKRKETNIKKYGVTNPLKLKEVIEKGRMTSIKKYGVPNPAQKNIHHFDIWGDNNKFLNYVCNLKEKISVFELAKYFNIDYGRAMRRIHDLQLEKYVLYKEPRSLYEDEIVALLHDKFPNLEIQTNVRGLLSSQRELDIYIPEYKLAIEFNGEFWHSDVHEKFQDHGGRSLYHQSKSLEAEEKGIFIFHIFEHEWDQEWINKNPRFANSRENIINRLTNLLIKNDKRIPARLCEVRPISKEDKKEFLNKNHIQGNDQTSNYFLGLYYQNQLVSCMCFGQSKYARYNWELTRFASLHGTTVQGGASKLFQYFVKNVLKDGENVVSYNDITKTKGGIYKILNFQCVSVNSPNYWWVNFDTRDIRTRYQEQAAGEVARMHSLDYYRICDCGTKTWVYTK